MSEDRPGSGVPEGELSEEQVARLLGAAGPLEPTPADVVSRLDAVLADLLAERAADGADEATLATLATPATAATSLDAERARRRRTWGPRLLVAAAVLGVAGVGLSLVDDLTSGSGPESASAGDAAGAREESSDGGGSTESGAGSSRASESARAPEVPRVLRISDDADLRAAVRGTAAGDVDALSDLQRDDEVAEESPQAANRAGVERCVTPRGPGRRTLVSYRGDPAVLVVRRTGGRLDGRVYDCDLGRQLDGVEIGPTGE